MKKSSNINMEHVFEQLANIKRVEPSANLYSKALQKYKKQNTVSSFWLNVAACFFIVIFCAEFYIISSKREQQQSNFSLVVPQTNNILYNE